MLMGLVACGSGVATSTVAQEAIKKILKEANIQMTLTKGTVTEIPTREAGVDIIFVTSNYNKPTTKPLIKVFGLISGINKEGIKKEIIAVCSELAKNK